MHPNHRPTRRLLLIAILPVILIVFAVGSVGAAQPLPRNTPTPGTGPSPTPKPTRPATGTPTATPNATATPGGGTGSFQVVDSPNVANVHNRLNAVAAVSADDIWTVGQTFNNNGSSSQTLIQHWDGDGWQIVGSPNGETGNNGLAGVAAAAANDVWAVGQYGGGSGPNWQPIITHYDGSAWSLVQAPSVGPGAARLNAVTVRAAGDIWAVGSFTNQSTDWWDQPLVIHWDGTAWSVVPSPQIGTSSELRAVAAIAPDDAWAVGYTLSTGYQALILHWDGSSWTQVAANAGLSTRLIAVAAVSEDDVWAVGSKNNGAATLILHWNGSVWTVVPSPNGNYPGANRHGLVGLAINSADDVWAVGTTAFSGLCGGSDASHYWSMSLALHWDGSGWTQVQTENPGTPGGCNTPRNDFYGVTTAGGTPIAVGAFYNPALNVQLYRTLVEEGP